ncbi:diuretic hormone receptor-like isoform X2 [Sitodiplosis mosellana]|uniref:diuretic hormone receptor-like isoform X2 n=1 Tax=Sitodiplosis mosellana TaxID=263140 RepID=UPI0024448FAD|nr:diuretic hormone receptor-like isoform X2 [Sitodiplosis mosellana]XP_055309679.1 diuretic hormone receptor-like isoform X2 [Sitodiplosis mosellana]XP_055309680.1 diuretic hormone receptor-like isoform X2 [Sitodiplosis mosellana]
MESTMEATPRAFDDASVSTLADILSTVNTTTEMETTCLMKGQLNPSQAKFFGCPVVFDSVSCWPATAVNTSAIVPCFTEFLGINYDGSQNASRFCHANGTWDKYANYDQCKHVVKDLPNEIDIFPQLELATHIYSIGYTLSLVALSLGLAVFIHFKDLRCLRNTIHGNLFLTYILSALLWIIPLLLGLTHNEATGAGCKCLVILLHYFTLTNFFWMLVEGLYLYMLVVETFSGDNLKFKMYAFIGWGCPAIIIAIWTAVKSFAPINESDGPNRQPVQMKCTWMHESHVDWIFHGSKMACLLVNLFFLIRIMWVLVIKLRSANTAETRQYKKASKALLVLIPLLGITYLILLFGPESGVYQHMFIILQSILISTQGFSVSLLYCFMNSEVKQALYHRLSIWREKRNIGNDTQMDYRKHRNGMSKDYSSPRSRTESIRLTSNSNGSTIP